MRNIPNRFQFSEHCATIADVKSYYDSVKSSLAYTYDETCELHVGESPKQIREEHKQMFIELNIEGGFALLSAVEAMFRTDFVCRCRRHKKEQIDKDFQESLCKVDQPYKIDIREDILERWKQEYPADAHVFSLMKERLDYRNWIAHGRYWNRFANAGKDKFSFESLCIEIDTLLSIVGSRLLKPEDVGQPA